jgi:hypothetical protein
VVTKSYFAHDGEITEAVDYVKHGFNIYAKYGLWHEDISLVGNFGLRYQKLEGVGSTTGLEDASFKLDWRFIKGDYPLAVSYEIGIPFSSPELGDQIALGDGEVDHTFRLYQNLKGFTLEAGYKLRSDGFTDSFLYGFQYSHNPFSGLYLS